MTSSPAHGKARSPQAIRPSLMATSSPPIEEWSIRRQQNKFLTCLLIWLIVFGLTACKGGSPMATVKQFFSLWQQEKYDKAFDSVVKSKPTGENLEKVSFLTDEEKRKLVETTKNNSGKIVEYSLQNIVPLKEEALKKLQVSEGYEVFFNIYTEKQGPTHNSYYLLKVNGAWKILSPISLKD